MLGHSGGGAPLSNRTMVGIRGITTDAPDTGQVEKKKAPKSDARLDRVERDERRDGLFDYVEPDEDEDDGVLAQPDGHGVGLRTYRDKAFRSDAQGRPLPPVFSDVDQGNLSDAWLLASAAAVAHAEPAAIVARIAQHEEGLFRVRLGRDVFAVAPEFPNEGYADPTPNGQRDTLWVALLEKAFAQREAGSYAHLETGNPARALEALTGRRAEVVALTDRTPLQHLGERLRRGHREKTAMVVHTRDGTVPSPLVADHAYAVLEVSATTVKLYNPWGTGGGKKSLESLIHDVPFEALRASADALFLSGPRG